MSAATEIQIGRGNLNGMPGAWTITPAGGGPTDLTFNTSDRSFTENFKMEELPAQTGSVIESVIASCRSRDVEMNFVPSASTRAGVITVINKLRAMTPLTLMTVATITGTNGVNQEYDGTYNLLPGLSIKETREGKVMASFKMRQYETAAAAGTFAGLAPITG